jgi:predicted small lipoprotein YifL
LNSKFLFFLLFLFILAGCGVKARPLVPPEKAIDSYIESFGVTQEKTPQPTPTPTPAPQK